MSWVTPPTHNVGDILTASDWNIVAADLLYLFTPPYPYVRSTATASFSALSGGATNVRAMSSAFTDTIGYGITVVSNHYVLPIAGRYLVRAGVRMPTNPSNGNGCSQYLLYSQNGGGAVEFSGGFAGGTNSNFTGSEGTTQILAAANDTIQINQEWDGPPSVGVTPVFAGIDICYMGAV